MASIGSSSSASSSPSVSVKGPVVKVLNPIVVGATGRMRGRRLSTESAVSILRLAAEQAKLSLSLDDDDASTIAGSTLCRTPRRKPSLTDSTTSTVTVDDLDEISEWQRQQTPSPAMRCYSAGLCALQPSAPDVLLLPMTIAVPATKAEGSELPASAAELPRSQATLPVERAVVRRSTIGEVPRGVSWADMSDDDEQDLEMLCFQCTSPEEAGKDAQSCAAPADVLLPSVGSAGHASGTCQPCAHVWRDTGCSKGRDCTYCHCCGQKEFLAYRHKSKRDKAMAKQVERKAELLALGNPAGPPKADHDRAPIPSGRIEISLSSATAALPSVGSAAHAHGCCRPCAHSWKPQGCSLGAACSFCHLCGESGFQAFRRLSKLEKEARVRGSEKYGAR